MILRQFRSLKMLRIAMAAGAMMLMTAALSARNACDDCHPGMSNLKCGVYTLNAISGCCGMGNGSASCSGGEFSVDCEGGGSCTCDEWGNDCEPGDLNQ
jgi:hypothetical protein